MNQGFSTRESRVLKSVENPFLPTSRYLVLVLLVGHFLGPPRKVLLRKTMNQGFSTRESRVLKSVENPFLPTSPTLPLVPFLGLSGDPAVL